MDDEGGGAVAVARQLLCSGVESSVWDCQHDVPTQWLHCPPQVLGNSIQLSSLLFSWIKVHQI